MLEWLMNCITWVINFIIYLFGIAINLIVSLLPNSPFSNVPLMIERNGIGQFFGYLSWIVPIKTILSITLAWVGCVAVYYIYSVALRFIKVVE